jgi:hypothetical protein
MKEINFILQTKISIQEGLFHMLRQHEAWYSELIMIKDFKSLNIFETIQVVERILIHKSNRLFMDKDNN